MTRLQALRSDVRVVRYARLAACMFALAVGTGAALAQSDAQSDGTPGAASWPCPAGYELIDLRPAYCTGSDGDIVRPVAVARPAAVACPSGYDRLWTLCISPDTGDVVRAAAD